MSRKEIVTSSVAYRLVAPVLGVLLFWGGTAHAATLQLDSSSATLSPGGIATLSVVVNSEGVAINNAEAKIVFPTDLLEVVSVSKGGSVFSLWVEEPAYSNLEGTVTFNGGVPTPGFNGSKGIAISVVVKAKKVGQAEVMFSDAAVRANDGLGTDVLRAKVGKTLSVVQKEEPVFVQPPPARVDVPMPALQVSSPTHPSQELWYTDSSPTFSWKIPAGVDAVQTGIDNHTGGSPRVTFSPAIAERTVADQKDGVWYFKVRARKNGEWGPVSTYIVRIDSTTPRKNDVVFSYDDVAKVLSIDADVVDETSGLDHYALFINDALVKEIPSDDFVNGVYALAVDSPGDNTVRLVAVDRAGNSVEASGAFTAAAAPVAEPEPEFVFEPVSATWSERLLMNVIPALHIVVAVLSAVLILVLSAFTLGRHYNNLRERLRVRASLSKADHSKVLFLVKRRLEKHLEIMQRIRHDRILSKEEKEMKEIIEDSLDEIDRVFEAYRANQTYRANQEQGANTTLEGS